MHGSADFGFIYVLIYVQFSLNIVKCKIYKFIFNIMNMKHSFRFEKCLHKLDQMLHAYYLWTK